MYVAQPFTRELCVKSILKVGRKCNYRENFIRTDDPVPLDKIYKLI